MSLPTITNRANFWTEQAQKLDKTNFRKYLHALNVKDGILIRKLDNEKKLYHKVKESFSYIPQTDEQELFNLIDFLHNREKKEWDSNFRHPVVLDVGAGTGAKVRMFIDNGIPAAGIEFQPQYVQLGRETHKLSSEELIYGDAFNLTKEFLSGFSVIYTYMPLSNAERMTELHNHLWKNSQIGTIFVEMFPKYYPMCMARDLGGFSVTEKTRGFYY